MTGVLKKGENMESKRDAQKENNVKILRKKSACGASTSQRRTRLSANTWSCKRKGRIPPLPPHHQRTQRDLGSVAALGLPSRTLFKLNIKTIFLLFKLPSVSHLVVAAL